MCCIMGITGAGMTVVGLMMAAATGVMIAGEQGMSTRWDAAGDDGHSSLTGTGLFSTSDANVESHKGW